MSTAVIVATELSHASDAMFSRFLYNFFHVCVEVDGVCVFVCGVKYMPSLFYLNLFHMPTATKTCFN